MENLVDLPFLGQTFRPGSVSITLCMVLSCDIEFTMERCAAFHNFHPCN